jgi:lipoprotein-anchoring transpeptidase ErfK/SrfK
MRWLLVTLALGACQREAAVPDDGLPFKYYLVSQGAGDLLAGFGVAFAEERSIDGERMFRTRRGRYLSPEKLEPAHAVRALGVVPERGRITFAWVADTRAPVFAHADEKEPPIGSVVRFERVELDEPPEGPWVRARGGYVKAASLRVPSASPRPAGVGPAERWIDVDTATQTLVVHDGDTPIFAALISTGTGAPNSRFGTPRGVHRVDWKVPHATMDNVDEGGDPPFSFEEVPWVQYFKKEVALHGAYWHQRFGHPASHGCVNLPPADARRLYHLTRATTPAYPGTVVRVR